MTEKAAGSSPCSWTSGKRLSKVSSFATNAQRLCDPGRDVSLSGARQERLDLGESGWRGVSDGEGGRGLVEGEEGCGGPWRRPPRGRSLSEPALEEDSWTSRARRRGDQRVNARKGRRGGGRVGDVGDGGEGGGGGGGGDAVFPDAQIGHHRGEGGWRDGEEQNILEDGGTPGVGGAEGGGGDPVGLLGPVLAGEGGRVPGSERWVGDSG